MALRKDQVAFVGNQINDPIDAIGNRVSRRIDAIYIGDQLGDVFI